MTVAVIVSIVIGLAAAGLGIWDLHKVNVDNTALRAALNASAAANGDPATRLASPANGDTVGGMVGLVTAPLGQVAAVDFLLSGGPDHNTKIATGNKLLIGWTARWNSKTVPNGSYQLVSIGFNAAGKSSRSASITFNVKN